MALSKLRPSEGWYAFFRTVLRFGIVGIGSIGVYFIALYFLKNWIDGIIVLTTTCYIISMTFNYLLQRNFTFRSETSQQHTWARYIVMHFTCIVINAAMMFTLVETLGLPIFVAQSIVTVIVTGTSFLLSYLWIYR